MESFRRRGWMILGLFVVLLVGSDQIQGRQGDPSANPESRVSAPQAKAPPTPGIPEAAPRETPGSKRDKDGIALQNPPVAPAEPGGAEPNPNDNVTTPGEAAPSKSPGIRNTLPIILFVISVLITVGLFGLIFMRLSPLTRTVSSLKRMNRLRPEPGYAESLGHVGPIDEKSRSEEGPSQEDLDNMKHSLESSVEDKFNRMNAALQMVMDSQKTLKLKADMAAAELDKIAALDQSVVILRDEQRGKYSELRNIIAELEKEVFSEIKRPIPAEESRPVAEGYPSRADEDVARQLYEPKNINPYTLQIAKLTEKYWAEIGGDVESLEKSEVSRFMVWFNGLLEGLDRLEISGEAGDRSRCIEERIFPLIDAIDGFFRGSEISASHPGIIREFDNYLHRVLDLYGIEEVRVEVLEDTFDGEQHQLVKTVTQSGYPLGTIIEIQKRGFSFEGSILRKPWVVQGTS